MTLATLLPNGEQVFLSTAGVPLAGGTVGMYIPNTTTPKDTWQDSGMTILNSNPIVLDAAGRAIIYGTGVYRQIVKDSSGNLVWDQLTTDLTSVLQASVLLWCGISGGSANTQTLTPSSPVAAYAQGQGYRFFAGFSNTGPTTVNISALGAKPVYEDTISGPVALTSGDIISANSYTLTYDTALASGGGGFHLQLVSAQGLNYLPPFTAAIVESQWEYNIQRVSVVDFMSAGQKADWLAGTALVNQYSALQALTTYISSLATGSSPGVVGIVPGGNFLNTTTVLLPTNVALDMSGADFIGPITGYAQINSGNSPAIPAGSNAADQIGGGCFQTPTPLDGMGETQWLSLKGGHFSGFRHAFVNTQELNGFSWDSPDWGDSNIGIFAYQAIAYCEISKFQTETCNVGIVASATCCTSDNPFLAASAAFYNFLGGMVISSTQADPEFHYNPTLDAWIEAAILRPSTATHASDGSGVYNLAANAKMLSCSGTFLYMPGRSNGQGGNGVGEIKNIHTTFSPRGTAIIGNAGEIIFQNISSEGNFQDTTVNAGPPFLYSQITAINCGAFTFDNIQGGGGLSSSVGPLSVIDATGSGGFVGRNISGNIVNDAAFRELVSNPNQVVGLTETPGDGLDGKLTPLTVRAVNSPQYFVSGGSILTGYVGGYQVARQDLGSSGVQFESTVNFSLPSSDGTESEALLSYFLQPEAAAIAGTMEVRLRNRETGTVDFALFGVRFGDSGISLGSFTGTASATSNTITLNKSGLANFGPGTAISITNSVPNTETPVVKSISSNGLTLTLFNNLTYAYSADTISAPFVIDYTAIALNTGTSWLSTLGDNAGRLELVSALATAITLDISLTFRYTGPPLTT